MSNVSIRDLRNQGGRLLNQVSGGETLTVTRAGKPVAELRPLERAPLTAETLLARWRWLPAVDADSLKADVDTYLDSTL